MLNEITITEALKKLKLIEKRMKSNIIKITQYSSILSTERPSFENENVQSEEIKQLIQANIDLDKEYRIIKKNIDYTNLTTQITFNGTDYSITDLLILKSKTGDHIKSTYNALNTSSADYKMRNQPSNSEAKVIQLYDEHQKNKKLRQIEDLLELIDGKLETINSTTVLSSLEK